MATLLQAGTEVDTSGLTALDAAAAQTAAALEALGAEFKKLQVKSAESSTGMVANMREVKEATVGAMEGMTTAAMSAGGGLAALGAALGIGAITEFINHMKEATLEVSHLAEATGISVEDITVLRDAMAAAGVSTERLPMQFTQLASAMEAAADGSQKQVDAFAALGINTANWANQMPSELAILKQLEDHTHTSTDATRDLAAMKVLLGRNAVGLTAFLKQGSEAIAEEESHFKAHGAAMEANVENALKLQRAETEFKTTLETELAPALGLVVDFFTGMSIIIVWVKAGWNDLIAIGKLLAVVIGEQVNEFDRLIHFDFKGYVKAQEEGLKAIKAAWVDTKTEIIKNAEEAEKKSNEIFARSQAPVRKPGGEGEGPAAPLRRPGASAQAELDAQKRLGEEKAKLLADQGKYEAQVSGQTDRLILAESALASSKNLEDKRAYAAQIVEIMQNQARAEKDAGVTALEQKFTDEEEYIRKSLALHQTASEADKKERARLHGELQIMEVRHDDELVRLATTFETRMAAARQRQATENARIAQEQATQDAKIQEQILRGREAAIDGELKTLDANVKRRAGVLAEEAKLHQISNSQEHDALVALYAQEYEERVKLLHQKEELFIQEAQAAAAAEGRVLTEEQTKLLPGYQKLYQQELADYQDFLSKKQKADLDAQTKLQKQSEQTAQTLTTAYDELILHAKNFHDAVSNLWQSLQKNFEQAATHMIAAWITSMLEGKAVSAETALGQIAHSAYVSAAHVYEATSGIPIIGPVLAPIAAAAAFTAVMAFGGGIGAAEHGAVLPQDMMILAHRNEMILPPSLSKGFADLIAGGASPGGTPAPVHISVSHNISAVDGVSVERVLHEHNAVLADAVRKAAKGGRLSAADFAR